MKAAWAEAHKALTASMDDNLANLAGNMEKQAADQQKMLADHADNHGNSLADIQAQLRGELDTHASNLQNLQDAHDSKHSENEERHLANTAAMENGLQNVLDSTHNKLQNELAELKSGHAANP